jgi:hypothetical protein
MKGTNAKGTYLGDFNLSNITLLIIIVIFIIS